MDDHLLNRAVEQTDPRHHQADALRRELAERDDLLAMLAHELRNPLHALKLQLEIARISAEAGQPSETLAKILKARTSLQRYTDRVTMLLDLIGRKEGYPNHPRLVDVAALLSEVAEGLRVDASYHRITLLCEVPLQPVMARIDPLVLEEIVENLLLNAFKHSGGDLVTLRLSMSADHGNEVEITDNGRGISRQDHARVFHKHEVGRGNSHTHGTGLGLWIVRRLIGVLGGAIALRSEAGAGCSFTVTFPSDPSSSKAR